MPLSSAPLGTSNRTSIRYVEEVNFGVTPITAPTSLRFTGESMANPITMESSKEIRSDRLTADLVPTKTSATGGFNFELSYGEYDPFFQATLGGTWDRMGTVGEASLGTCAINSTAGTITAAAAPTGNDAMTRLKVGQWFRLKAPSDAADGAFLQVLTVSSTVLTVNTLTPIPGTGTRAAVALCKLSSSRVTDGTVKRAFSIERSFDDINQFFIYRGMSASKFDLSFAPGALITGTFDFLGKNGERANTSNLAGGTVTSQTGNIMNTVTGFGSVLVNGVALTGTFLKSVKISVDGKLRALDGLGTYGSVAVNQGTLMISGTLEVYLADGTFYDYFTNNTATSLTFGTRDGSSVGYQFTLPKLKFKDAKVNAGGLDQDAMLSIPFECLFDSVTGHAVILDAFTV